MLENIIILLLMAAFVAAVAKVFHHAIGSPSIKPDGGIDFKTNRILGGYGRWLVINQVKLMNKEVQEQQDAYKKMMDDLRAKEIEEADAENRKADFKGLTPDPIEVTKINTKGKVSIWMPLGMCMVCFSTWFSVFSFLVILPSFGLSLLWLPFVAAVSTMITTRI